jgi:hypothetical protein
VGGRYVIRKEEGGKFAATHITATYNHLGRVKTTYTLPFSETVFASARYTVNALAEGHDSTPTAMLARPNICQPAGRSPSTPGHSRVSPSLTRQGDNHPRLVLITGRWW